MSIRRERPRAHTRFLVATAAAGFSVAAWLIWLGFHAEQTTAPGGTTETGPYEPWQVAGLALTLIVGVSVMAFLVSPVPLVVGGVGGLGLVAALDWSTAPSEDASLWPIGVFMLVVGAAAVGALIALVAAATTRRRTAPGAAS